MQRPHKVREPADLSMSTSKKLRVLVVEDDVVLARAIARTLATPNLDVHTAHGCAAAMARSGPYDCGVFDIELPDGNGVDLAEDLLADGRVQVAVFYSSTGDQRSRERAARLGDLVSKAEPIATLRPSVQAAVAQELGAIAVGDEREHPLGRRSRTASGTRRRVPR